MKTDQKQHENLRKTWSENVFRESTQGTVFGQWQPCFFWFNNVFINYTFAGLQIWWIRLGLFAHENIAKTHWKQKKNETKNCKNLLKICDENVFWYSTEEMFRGHFCGTAEKKVLFGFHTVFIERDWKYGGYIWVFSFTKTMSKTLEKQKKHNEINSAPSLGSLTFKARGPRSPPPCSRGFFCTCYM